MPTDDDLRWCLLDSKAKETALAAIVEKLRDKSIEAIAFKGWTVARAYPSTSIRAYTDVDLSIRPDQFDDAVSLLRDGTRYGAAFDLHRGFRKLDHTDWGTLFQRSRLELLENEEIRLLSEEDNLRVTATHWLLDGGVYKERLFDIKYLVEGRKADFDWDTCLNSSGPVRREWVLAAIVAARDELALDTRGLPRYIAEFQPPKWFFRALRKEWRRGVYRRIPLALCLRKPKLFVEQIWRRFPPNPIAAMVDTEGSLSQGRRSGFQLRSLSNKIRPFFQDIRRAGEIRSK